VELRRRTWHSWRTQSKRLCANFFKTNKNWPIPEMHGLHSLDWICIHIGSINRE